MTQSHLIQSDIVNMDAYRHRSSIYIYIYIFISIYIYIHTVFEYLQQAKINPYREKRAVHVRESCVQQHHDRMTQQLLICHASPLVSYKTSISQQFSSKSMREPWGICCCAKKLVFSDLNDTAQITFGE